MAALGTELKINVHIEPIDGLHMENYDFVCQFFAYPNRKVEIHKEDMKKIDSDNYLAMITEEQCKRIGRGELHLEVTAYVPDSDFFDGLRTEKATICTGVTIM